MDGKFTGLIGHLEKKLNSSKILKKTYGELSPKQLSWRKSVLNKKPDIPLSITHLSVLPGCNYRPGHYSSSGKVQAFGHPKEICQQEVWQDLRVPRANIESRGRHGFRELLNLNTDQSVNIVLVLLSDI